MLDVSGIIHVRDNCFLATEDESDRLRLFELDSLSGTFTQLAPTIELGHSESDFESLAFNASTHSYYCIGSHGADYSRRLVRFQLSGQVARSISEIPFDAGQLVDGRINIEALSVWQDRLLVGYRSPNRKGDALLAVLDPESGGQLLTRIDLDGQTFRDMDRIDPHNYLILAGPERGKHYRKHPSRIIWWDGSLLAPKLVACPVDLSGVRAEGLAVRSNPAGGLDILVCTDESRVKSARHFRTLHLHVASLEALLEAPPQPVELAIQL